MTFCTAQHATLNACFSLPNFAFGPISFRVSLHEIRDDPDTLIRNSAFIDGRRDRVSRGVTRQRHEATTCPSERTNGAATGLVYAQRRALPRHKINRGSRTGHYAKYYTNLTFHNRNSREYHRSFLHFLPP